MRCRHRRLPQCIQWVCRNITSNNQQKKVDTRQGLATSTNWLLTYLKHLLANYLCIQIEMWSYFGGSYFWYGEHWRTSTCVAACRSRERLRNSSEAPPNNNKILWRFSIPHTARGQGQLVVLLGWVVESFNPAHHFHICQSSGRYIKNISYFVTNNKTFI